MTRYLRNYRVQILLLLGAAFALVALGIIDANALPFVVIGMAAPADYLDTSDLKGIAKDGLVNEDVLQKIFDISDIDLEFTKRAGSGTIKNTYYSWVYDALQSVDTSNAVIPGADAGTTGQEAAADARVGNHTQLSDKLVQTTTTTGATSNIGGEGMPRQVARRLIELHRDVEAIALTGQASVAAVNQTSGQAAGKTAGISAQLVTNDLLGTDGAATGFNTSTGVFAAVDVGDKRALLFNTHIRELVEDIYLQNGNPTTLMTVPQIVKALNTFLNSSNNPYAPQQANVVGDQKGAGLVTKGNFRVIQTDFGFNLEIVPNRLQQTYASDDSTPGVSADVFLFDFDTIDLVYLQSYKVEMLGKVGHSDRKLISVEWGTRVGTEFASGVIRDIDTSGTVAAS